MAGSGPGRSYARGEAGGTRIGTRGTVPVTSGLGAMEPLAPVEYDQYPRFAPHLAAARLELPRPVRCASPSTHRSASREGVVMRIFGVLLLATIVLAAVTVTARAQSPQAMLSWGRQCPSQVKDMNFTGPGSYQMWVGLKNLSATDQCVAT